MVQAETFTRRDFARLLAAAGVAVPLFPVQAEDQKPVADKPKTDQVPEEKPEPAEPKPVPVERLLMLVVARLYPHENLTPEILENIYQDIQGDLRRSRALSSFPLTNADEPAFHFAAYRNDPTD